jgi:hypothetical protein
VRVHAEPYIPPGKEVACPVHECPKLCNGGRGLSIHLRKIHGYSPKRALSTIRQIAASDTNGNGPVKDKDLTLHAVETHKLEAEDLPAEDVLRMALFGYDQKIAELLRQKALLVEVIKGLGEPSGR